jgi:hypothetical protein
MGSGGGVGDITWKQMWDIICIDRSDAVAPCQPNPTSDAMPSCSFHHPLSKRVNREHLAKSHSVAELNRVRDSKNTASAIKVATSIDKAAWREHLEENLQKQGTLFLVKLAHYEGEFALGLGRRTFAETDTAEEFEMEWFERKNKKQSAWGKRPGFKLTVAAYDKRRKPIPQKSPESLSDFLEVIVETSGTQNEPVLSEKCLVAIRQLQPKPVQVEQCAEIEDSSGSESGSPESNSESESPSESEPESSESIDEEEGSPARAVKRRRKM